MLRLIVRAVVPTFSIALLLIVVGRAVGGSLSASVLAYTAHQGVSNREIYILDVQRLLAVNISRHPSDDGNPIWSPDGRKLAFESGRDGGTEIYVFDLDSGLLRNISEHRELDSAPVWSPDSTRIAYLSQRGGIGQIYIYDLGINERFTISQPYAPDADPAWSPDGERLAFLSYRGGATNRVYIHNFATNTQSPLDHPDGDYYAPIWSPDGELLSFYSVRDRDFGIYLVGNVRESPQRLSSGDAATVDYAPVWSPNGRLMAYLSNRDGRARLMVRAFDGEGTAVEASDHIFASSQPRWSPPRADGSYWLAFESYRRGTRDIFVVQIAFDGTLRGVRPLNITLDLAEDTDPQWSPDGSQIAFVSDRGGTTAIYVLDIQTAQVRRISPRGFWYTNPVWSPR